MATAGSNQIETEHAVVTNDTKWLMVAAGLAIAAAGSLFGQTSVSRRVVESDAGNAGTALQQFEVASIKPSGPNQDEMNGFYTFPGGRVVCRGCSVQYLIMVAFDAQRYQITGGPSWIDLVRGARFEIQAEPPAASLSIHSHPTRATNPLNEEQRQMLQSLLIDRFHLKYHRVTKQGPIYILARGDGELRLRTPKDKVATSGVGGLTGGWFGGGIRGQNISMPQLAVRLSRFLERPVLEQTGLQGSFDFEFRFGTADNDADIPGFLLTAMKGIGLKLSSGKGPVETFAIDHVEKPSEN